MKISALLLIFFLILAYNLNNKKRNLSMAKTTYNFGFNLKQRHYFLQNELKEFTPKYSNPPIYIKNISEIQQLLYQFDNDKITKLEAINAYMILGSLVESLIDVYFIYSKTEDELKKLFERNNRLNIPLIGLEKKINIFNEVFEGKLTPKIKNILDKIREKRNYIHFLNRDFDNWTVDDVSEELNLNPYYSELCLDVMAYDLLFGEIINEISNNQTS